MQFIYLVIIFLITGLIRYYLSKLIHNKLKDIISYGALILNIIVCFLIGFFMVYLSSQNTTLNSIGNINNVLITIFIAFSASSYKAVHFLKNKMLIKASTNIFYNLFLGLVFLTLGNLIAQ